METTRLKIASEVFGVILIAATVLMAISLFSYNPGDPSFNSYLSGSAKASNNAGIIGACMADLLVQTAGAMAWLAPLGLLYVGLMFCHGPRIASLAAFFAGFAALITAASAFTHIHWAAADPMFAKAVSGGALGQIVAEKFMVRWFSVYGSYVILLALAISSTLLITRMSVSRAVENLVRLAWRTKLWAFMLAAVAWRWMVAVKDYVEPMFFETEEARGVREKRTRKTRKKEHALKEPLLDEVEETDEDDTEIFIPSREPAIVTIDPENPPPLPPGRRGGRQKNSGEDEFQQEMLKLGEDNGDYVYPALKLLDTGEPTLKRQSREELIKRSMILEKKLLDFGIDGKVVQVLPGPVITVYEFEPAPGVKVSKIVSLSDDLAMVLRATSVRILAPVPGKSVVGIEVPNPDRETIYLKELLGSDEFSDSASKMTLALGKDVSGAPMMADLAHTPHLLIAGSTGSGKSVGINAMICSILYKASPADVKFIMIDPKMLELSIYEGIPHLIAPVVTNPKKAANALKWAVEEMEKRYEKLSELGVRNIDGYNRYVEKIREAEKKSRKTKGAFKTVAELEAEGGEEQKPREKLPYIVVVIDELADLMMVAAKDVEDALARLAQMARAAGIHLIVATQRPSVDVLTGLIKANFPARISYLVRSRIDSRTILDSMGADKLLGKGDMLYLPPATSKLQRVHGPFVSDQEIHRLVDFLKGQGQPVYDEEVLKAQEAGVDGGGPAGMDEDFDEFYDQAVELVAKTRQASISMIQRRFRIGYNRAARIVETMERQGLVGPADGLKPREVFMRELDDVETVN